jgi:hypothetical protein
MGGCSVTNIDGDEDGTFRAGLWGESPDSGETYSLQSAVFSISSNELQVDLGTDGLADGTPSVATSLPAGDYVVVLQPGWQVWRGDVGDPAPEVVDATLASENPVAFAIEAELATQVTYVFDIAGEMVPMNEGSVDIDVEFNEPCSTAAECPASASPCMVAACVDGECMMASATAGTACNDGLFCTATDACNATGVCVGNGNPCPGADGDSNCSETCNETADNCSSPDPSGTVCGACRECSAGSCVYQCNPLALCCGDVCVAPGMICP